MSTYLKDELSQLSAMYSGMSKNNPKKRLKLIFGLEMSYSLFGLNKICMYLYIWLIFNPLYNTSQWELIR